MQCVTGHGKGENTLFLQRLALSMAAAAIDLEAVLVLLFRLTSKLEEFDLLANRHHECIALEFARRHFVDPAASLNHHFSHEHLKQTSLTSSFWHYRSSNFAQMLFL